MAIYAYATFVVGIAMVAFLVFLLGYAYSYVAAVGYKVSIDTGTNSTETDPNIAGSTGYFLNNFWAYITIPLSLIVLGWWLLSYIQKKGGQVYGEV